MFTFALLFPSVFSIRLRRQICGNSPSVACEIELLASPPLTSHISIFKLARIECMLSSCLPALSPSNLFRSFSKMSPLSSSSSSTPVDLLILGAGWTSSFLIPHLQTVHPSISFASTTRDGRNSSIKWEFNPDSNDPADYDSLPAAKTVLITFPIKGEGGSRNLVEGYEKSKGGKRARWIQLGSTGIWDVRRTDYLSSEDVN